MRIGKSGEPISRVSQAYPDRVEIRGRDLTGDLMGKVSFTEYFHLLLTGREPTDDQRYFLDLLLVSIAEHGMMPSNVAARMTLAADPESLHGAVAAGILGAARSCWARPRSAPGCSRKRRSEWRPVRGRSAVARIARAVHTSGGKLPGSATRFIVRSTLARSGSSSSRTLAV